MIINIYKVYPKMKESDRCVSKVLEIVFMIILLDLPLHHQNAVRPGEGRPNMPFLEFSVLIDLLNQF